MTSSKANLLITGGAGFLGSHMVASCLEKDIEATVLDNLSNSDCSNLKVLEAYFNKRIPFFNIDLRDSKALKDFFDQNEFSAIIHFAGLKSVSESIQYPSLYYENNVLGSKNLIECIKAKRIKKIIFSSSATVYGKPLYLPIDETHPRQPTNPYGESKAQVEDLYFKEMITSQKKRLRQSYDTLIPLVHLRGLLGKSLAAFQTILCLTSLVLREVNSHT